MLVVVAGPPGTGKSELARGLSRQLRIPAFSVDPIESAMLGPFPEPTWEEIDRRRLAYTPWSGPVFRVDAALPLEDNVARTVTWLSGEHS